jgi:cytochrome b561
VELIDTKSGYGWVSIALHWLTAATVVVMWTVGSLSQTSLHRTDPSLVYLHTSIGIAVWSLLWVRIIWRFAVGHPGPLPGQGRFLFAVVKCFHFLLLIAIGVMLLSGPLVVWSTGDGIHVFGLVIPSPFGMLPEMHQFLRDVHGYTASLILAGMGLHLLGVLKHVIWNRDETLDKMIVASRNASSS